MRTVLVGPLVFQKFLLLWIPTIRKTNLLRGDRLDADLIMGDFTSSAAASKQSFSAVGNVAISQYEYDASGYESCLLGYEWSTVCTNDAKTLAANIGAAGPGHGQ